jgi:hypothetical protein
MSGLIVNRGGFHAQGSEINGKGVSEEQSTIGKVVTENGLTVSLTELATAVTNKRARGKA